MGQVRHGSATTELNVISAAVSHQVKALEDVLSCNLFRRLHRSGHCCRTLIYEGSLQESMRLAHKKMTPIWAA